MDFGRVPESALTSIDFTLPKGDDSILPGSPVADFKFYIGAAKWGKPEWNGKLYPKRTKEADFLDEYIKHFNYVELNAVFFQTPNPAQVQRWVSKMSLNPKFKCTPKVSRIITHIKRLNNADEDTRNYIETIKLFGSMLGPCFLQIADKFSPKHLNTLEQYLLSLPDDFRVNVELRHPEWYESDNFKNLSNLMNDLDVGLILTDTPGRRDVLHMCLTTNSVHIRYNAVGIKEIDDYRLTQWAAQITQWKLKGIKETYFSIDMLYDNQVEFPNVYLKAKEIFSELI